jgi:glyoxylase-like metal-dependent hydrolase (beta-lactamase superfamily II)
MKTEMTGSTHDGNGTQVLAIGNVTVLLGDLSGRYPHGNSLLVAGAEERLIIDPSLSVISRRPELGRVDRVLNSHCHEDHIAGNHLFPDAPWYLHEADLPGIQSLDNMMAIYGYLGAIDSTFRQVIVEQFHYTPRPDARALHDGDVFDLGGTRLRVIHAPGHTRGHCLFHIEPEDVLYLADIDLSSFGPYYGDAWSSLEDFERTLQQVAGIEARWFATFHHVGVVEGRAAFLERLEQFAAIIATRERRLLDFLRTPRSVDEIVAHRFVFRPQDQVPFAEAVERRSMQQHIERLVRAGGVAEVDPGRYIARGQ